jgi:hypothetical protein
MKKKVRKICKNCKLYNAQESVCSVVVMHEGEYMELKVRPTDHCWWERMEQELAMIDGEETSIPINEVRIQYDLDSKNRKIELPMEDNPYA